MSAGQGSGPLPPQAEPGGGGAADEPTAPGGASSALSLCTGADLADVVALVNAAYRGQGGESGWTHEIDVVEGERTTVPLLERDLAEAPSARILLHRAGGRLHACVRLDEHGVAGERGAVISMLAVHPGVQDRGLGRVMLECAEREARNAGARRAKLTVVSIRGTLIAWYERRGYRRTGAIEEFPYGDPRFGQPLRRDLEFVVLEKRLLPDQSHAAPE